MGLDDTAACHKQLPSCRAMHSFSPHSRLALDAAIGLTHATVRREKKDGKTKRIYEKQPQTPYERLLASPDIAEATKARLRAEHALLDPFALKKRIEAKLKNFFNVLSNLNRESTKT
jgi:hypothetical protein